MCILIVVKNIHNNVECQEINVGQPNCILAHNGNIGISMEGVAFHTTQAREPWKRISLIFSFVTLLSN